MDDITPPRPGSKVRFIDCQLAIEARLQQIVEDAYIAGWEPSEVLAAIIEVADNIALQFGENEALKDLLTRLKDNRPGDDYG
jgi:hypothetical protein